MADRKRTGLDAKPGAFEDLSDIKFHSLAELRQRGREVAEGTREATGMLDVAGFLEFRREERWAALDEFGCCGGEPDNSGYCRMGRCPVVSEAQKIIREMERIK